MGETVEPNKTKILGEKSKTFLQKITEQEVDTGITLPLGRRLYYGAQIMHQKEILVTDDNEDNSNTETSLSLLNTPDMRNLNERNLHRRKGQRSITPGKLPTHFLISIDEREGEGEDQEDQYKIKDFAHTTQKENERGGCQNKEKWSPETLIETTSPLKEKLESRREKRKKSKMIKKILKERLNIDCLRMLCEESSDDDITRKNFMNQSSQNLNDSYHVLMKEIGIDVNEGLSAAFLEKNGEVERQELNSFTEMFSVRDLLGVGAFGVVLLVKNRVTKEKSALKIISKERLSSRAQKILKNESTIMQTMNHPSVVSLKRIFENQKFIILEMELIPGGQLKRLFKFRDEKGNPRPISDLEASLVMKSLLQGVAYVHARDIVHRDLKPENILLADEQDDCHDVKIVDFGLSAEQNWRQRQNEKAGTLIYMAPEQVTKKGYSKKVDLWACGIIAFQLLACGQHPCYFKGQDYCKKLENIETEPIEWTFPENFSSLAKDFFLNLCTFPPSLRYDAVTALQHPWITRKSSDEIPLNKQQEFAMFKQESRLRKVMRLVYFISHVKICQINANTTFSSLDTESPDRKKNQLKLRQTSHVLNGEGRQHSTERVQVCASTTEQSAEELESRSPDLRFKSSLLSKPSQTTTSATTKSGMNSQQYFHNTFLQNSLADYKEFLLRESIKNNSIDSTSTKSKSQTSQENNNNAQQKAAKSSISQQDNKNFSLDHQTQAINRKTSLNKQKQRKTQQKKVINSNMLSPQPLNLDKADTSFSNNGNLNPAQILKIKSDSFVQSIKQASDPSKLEKQADKLIKVMTGSDFDRDQLNAPEGLQPLVSQKSFIVSERPQASQNNLLKQGDGVQIRPGRNLVSMKSPDRLNFGLEKTANNGSVDLTQGINNTVRSKFDQKQRQSSQIETGSAENRRNISTVMIDSIEFDKNRLKNNVTVHPFVQAPILDVLTTENAFSIQTEKQSDMSLIAGVNYSEPKSTQNASSRPDYIVPQAAKRNSTLTNQLNLDPNNTENKTMQDMVNHVILDTLLDPVGAVDDTKRLYDQKNSVRESKRRFSRKSNIMSHQSTSSPKQKHDLQEQLAQNKDPTLDMVTTKQEKSNKKRPNQKRKQMREKNSFIPKKLAQQTTFDASQNISNRKSIHASLNKMHSSEEPRIDWFQMIQAEKTVGGSRVLQEHLHRGSPIYEHKDESMRSSCNPTQLNSEYFQRQGQHNNKQHAPLLGLKALSQNQKQNRGVQPTTQYLNKSPTVSLNKSNKQDTQLSPDSVHDNYFFQSKEGQQLQQYYSTNTPQNVRISKQQHLLSASNSQGGGAAINVQSPVMQNKNKKNVVRTKIKSLKKLNQTSDPCNTIEESQQPGLNNLTDNLISKTRYGAGDSLDQKQYGNSSTVYMRRKSSKKIMDCTPNQKSEQERKYAINDAPCQDVDGIFKKQGTTFIDVVKKQNKIEVSEKNAISTLESEVGDGLVNQSTFTQSPSNQLKAIDDQQIAQNASVSISSAPKSLVDRRRPKSRSKKLPLPQSLSQESLMLQQSLQKNPIPFLSIAASNDSILQRVGSRGQFLTSNISNQSQSDLNAPFYGKESFVQKNQLVSKKEGDSYKVGKGKKKSGAASNVQNYVAQGAKLQAAAKHNMVLLTEESTDQSVAKIISSDSNWWLPMLNGSVKFGGVSTIGNPSLVQTTSEPIQQQQSQFNAPTRQGFSYQRLFKCQQSPGNKFKTKNKNINFNGLETPETEDQVHDSKRRHGKQSSSRAHRQLNHHVPQSANQMRRNQTNMFEHRMASQGQQIPHKMSREKRKEQGFGIQGVQLGGGQTNTIERQ